MSTKHLASEQTKHFKKLLFKKKKIIALLHNGRSNNSFFIVPEMDKLLLFLVILKMSILAHILALRDQLFTTADYRASTCGCMGIISAHFILKTIFCVLSLLINQNSAWCLYSRREDKQIIESAFFNIFP